MSKKMDRKSLAGTNKLFRISLLDRSFIIAVEITIFQIITRLGILAKNWKKIARTVQMNRKLFEISDEFRVTG